VPFCSHIAEIIAVSSKVEKNSSRLCFFEQQKTLSVNDMKNVSISGH